MCGRIHVGELSTVRGWACVSPACSHACGQVVVTFSAPPCLSVDDDGPDIRCNMRLWAAIRPSVGRSDGPSVGVWTDRSSPDSTARHLYDDVLPQHDPPRNGTTWPRCCETELRWQFIDVAILQSAAECQYDEWRGGVQQFCQFGSQSWLR